MNLRYPDKLQHFQEMMGSHYHCLSVTGAHTDMVLVCPQERESIRVHKALLLPLCPLLVSAALAVAPEEPTIILPDVSMEVVSAFLRILYQGHCVLSSSSPASEVAALR